MAGDGESGDARSSAEDLGGMGHAMWAARWTDGRGDGDVLERDERQGWGWGGPKASFVISPPPAATMGCCCSSDYDEDWIENIDICEHCNYPIEPDSKRQVRRGQADPPFPLPVAKRLQTPRPPSQWPNTSRDGHGMAKSQEGEGSRGSLSPLRG